VPENGGSQIKVLVVSTWRSGSSFLGELISSYPASCYQFEPLGVYGKNYTKLRAIAVEAMQKILRCDYSDYGESKLNSLKQLGTE
jgi:hypothetical protein